MMLPLILLFLQPPGAAELFPGVKVLDDPTVVDYLTGLAAPDAPIQFRVLETRDLRACAFAFPFPDRHVYISTGLIGHTKSESELAGILAHLVAHQSVPPRRAPEGTIPMSIGFCSRYDSFAVRNGFFDKLEAEADVRARPVAPSATSSPEYVSLRDRFVIKTRPPTLRRPSDPAAPDPPGLVRLRP
jgi:hypothetical protein